MKSIMMAAQSLMCGSQVREFLRGFVEKTAQQML